MAKKQVTIPIFVPHQGCPHQCAFCNQFQISGTRTTPDHEFVQSEVRKYLESIPDSVMHIEVAFFGGSFTGIDLNIQKELLNSVQEFRKNKLINGIRLSTRPDYITKDTLYFLKKYNVTTIELGVQSFDENVLKLSERGHTRQDVINAVELIKSFKFNFIIQLMPGLPGDNAAISRSDALTATQLKPEGVRIYPTIVLKNTKLELLYNQNLYSPLSLDEAIDRCASMTAIFKKNQIPIIRMGLHPLDKNELDKITAGPYHTAFGFMVNSKLTLNQILDKINIFLNTKSDIPKSLHLHLPNIKPEEYIGLKKSNINYLRNKFKNIIINYSISNNKTLSISGEY